MLLTCVRNSFLCWDERSSVDQVDGENEKWTSTYTL